MNKSKRLTNYMAVSSSTFRHNLRLSPTSAHAQPRGICREPLVFHGVLPLTRPPSNHWRLRNLPTLVAHSQNHACLFRTNCQICSSLLQVKRCLAASAIFAVAV